MDIKVRDLKQTDKIENNNKLLVLVNDDLNLVKNITKEEFLTNVISESENNALVQETDGNLYVNTSEISDSITELDTKFTNQIGDLNNLTTEDKTNLVTAINEAAQSASGSGTGGLNLFDLVMKDYILSFEEGKGLALLGTYVYKTGVSGTRYGYPDFYNRCVAEKSAGTETQVTLGSNTITMYVNANGHQFYDIADKSAVDAWFDTYGVAWYYGVDEENERIFLPRQDIALLTPKTQLKIYGDGNSLALTNDNLKVACISSISGYGSAHYYVPTYFTNAFPIGSASGSINQSAQVSTGHSFGVIPKSLAVNGITSGLISDSFTPDSSKYIYMVVGNTTQQSAITDVVDVTTSENDTLPLFTPMYFNHKPNNASWLKAGQQVNSGGIYTFAYNELVNELTTSKYELKVIETANKVSGTDYSEYWEINQTEMWFKTPTSISYKALNGKAKGNGKGLGLTDGTYNIGLTNDSSAGVIRKTGSYNKNVGAINTANNDNLNNLVIGLTSNSANSGIIAEEAPSQLYFKVANAVQNLELMNAGAITETLADKVDLDNTQWATNACVPDYSSGITITSGYTAPCSGWIYFCTAAVNGSKRVNAYINGISVGYAAGGSTTQDPISMYAPVGTGDVITFENQAAVTFFPLKGSNLT